MSRSVDISTWGKFPIGKLFTVKKPNARSQANYSDGDVPFIASGNYNNGVLKYLEPKKDEILDKGNCITVSPVDGSAFYQEQDFLGRGGAGSSILLLYNNNLNVYNGYFISTVIRILFQKYHYSDMCNGTTIKKEIIPLPQDKNGNPDWDYMTQYMQGIKNKAADIVNQLKSVIP